MSNDNIQVRSLTVSSAVTVQRSLAGAKGVLGAGNARDAAVKAAAGAGGRWAADDRRYRRRRRCGGSSKGRDGRKNKNG
jgi:hypothetical protein